MHTLQSPYCASCQQALFQIPLSRLIPQSQEVKVVWVAQNLVSEVGPLRREDIAEIRHSAALSGVQI
jgi:hypothetical protein